MKSLTRVNRLVRLLTLPLVFMAASAQASSAVWLVEKDGHRMYLGGTMHMLSADDYPLPRAYEQAYGESSRIVFETDISELSNPSFIMYMMSEVKFENGVSLRQKVSAETWQALEEFFTSRGVPMSSIEIFKPGMVALQMTMVELQRLGVSAAGVDMHFYQRALTDGKPLGKLETAREQIAFLANMGAGQEDEMLLYSLADVERLPELWKTMTQAWRSGDLEWLDRELAQPMREDFPEVFESLMVKRNNAWMPQLEAMSHTPEVEFVLVGAMHLSGEEGLLDMLAAQGHTITQLP